ncbi:CCR4-NOT regulatory complex component [Nowakowskiella sp. JEL0407]|nr:CCR4-NOT regulatory complex component [Nowakowskiella sp. JEL0407]
MQNPQSYPAADSSLCVEVHELNFDFGGPPILTNLELSLPLGCRCLLVGPNGAGKSTLLRILAGKRLVKGNVNVLGRNVFYDSPPVSIYELKPTPKGITYLGTEWAGNPIVRRDVPVTRLLKSQGAEKYPERCAKLLEIMDVDVNWHMHAVSDGQRRRVQIVLGLLEPFDLLLLDEVTTDLDVLVRTDLLQFLYTETVERGASIIYATHIFDGLGSWPSHVAHISDGRIEFVKSMEGFKELEDARMEAVKVAGEVSGLKVEHANGSSAKVNGGVNTPGASRISVLDNSPLLRVVEGWMRKDYEKKRIVKRKEDGTIMTKWDILSENMKAFGDKYYNYWN